jgi:hypothetical protein
MRVAQHKDKRSIGQQISS